LLIGGKIINLAWIRNFECIGTGANLTPNPPPFWELFEFARGFKKKIPKSPYTFPYIQVKFNPPPLRIISEYAPILAVLVLNTAKIFKTRGHREQLKTFLRNIKK